MNLDQIPYLNMPFLAPEIEVRHGADGAWYIDSMHPLLPREPSIPHLLKKRAASQADKVWLGQKDEQDSWRTISYGEFDSRSDAAAQWLLNRGMNQNDCVLVISENSIAHAVIMMAAMKARVPVSSVSAQYSLLDPTLSKLKLVVEVLRPSLVFAECGHRYKTALDWLQQKSIPCVTNLNGESTTYNDLIQASPGPGVAASMDAITDSTIAKLLFTSGSTGSPKCVVHTQGSLCAQVAGLASILVDTTPGQFRQTSLQWMPWSHVSAGTIAYHEALLHGGAIYIDDGKPTPELFVKTIANLRELPTSVFGSAPLGLSWLATALEQDEILQKTFFSELESIAYGGSALPADIAERIQRLAVKNIEHRVPIVSMYGSTEAQGITATYWPTSVPGVIGLPIPGVGLKLAPDSGKLEVRVKGDTLMQEYLNEEQATESCFDEEGYFGMGDAARFAIDDQPNEGLVFDGRITEDFKLLSGTWVSTASVKANLLGALGKLVRDLVICGENQNSLIALAWFDENQIENPLKAVEELTAALSTYNSRHPASSKRVQSVVILSEPASMAEGEINDKAYINTRLLQQRRAATIQACYDKRSSGVVLEVDLKPS